MREDYERIYARLHSQYYEALRSFGRSSRQVEWIDKIRHTIRTSSEQLQLGSRLRPDAAYFLLINFHQMIVRPVIDPQNFAAEEIENQLHGILASDIRDILARIFVLSREQIKP
jgi:hypothetical protein